MVVSGGGRSYRSDSLDSGCTFSTTSSFVSRRTRWITCSNLRHASKEELHLLELFRRFHDLPISIVGDDVSLGQFWDVDMVERHHRLVDLLVVKFCYLSGVFPFDDLVAEITKSQCPILSEEYI